MMDDASILLCFMATFLTLLGCLVGYLAGRAGGPGQARSGATRDPDETEVSEAASADQPTSRLCWKLDERDSRDSKVHFFNDCSQLKKSKHVAQTWVICEDCFKKMQRKRDEVASCHSTCKQCAR